MSDLLFGVLDWLCGGLAAIQFVAGLICLYSLCRKSVPELWGINWIDILFRLERDFQLEFHPSDFQRFRGQRRTDLTAGELYEIVQTKLSAAGRPVPCGAWYRMKIAIHEALNVSPLAVRRHSRLYADMGME